MGLRTYASLFHIDANNSERLLYMQGVILDRYDNPEVHTRGLAFFRDVYSRYYEHPLDETACRPIGLADIPATHPDPEINKANSLVRSFLQNRDNPLYANAYALSFTGVHNIENASGMLQIPQQRYFIDNSFLKLHVTGLLPPTKPGDLTGTADSPHQVLLQWSDRSRNESGFTLQRRIQGAEEFSTAGDVGANVTACWDKSVISGTSYEYRIAACNAAGCSAFTEAVTVVTPQTIPDPPDGLTASPISQERVQLSWTDNSHNESEFVILRKGPADPDYVEVGSVPGDRSKGAEGYEDTEGLTQETSYDYRVLARNEVGDSAFIEAGVTTFPPWEEMISTFVCEIGFQPDFNGIADHWIPNTDELCRPFTVRLEGRAGQDVTVALTEGMNVKLLAPQDANWTENDVADAPEFNLERNKGTCSYGLFATGADGTERLQLATFSRNAGSALCNFTYNSDYFDQVTGLALGCTLRLDSLGYVVFTCNGSEYTHFSISTLAGTGIVRPGDDFLLRFTVLGYDQEIAPATATDGDFLAVYDKKMLWRANLYIDERKEENGNWKVAEAGVNLGGRAANCGWDEFTSAEKEALDELDWNGRNPWRAAEGNAWDERGNGKQVEIEPWTHWTGIANSAGLMTIHNTVAYNYGAHDSFPQFNIKMRAQYNAMIRATGNANFTWPPDSWDNYVSAGEWMTPGTTIEDVLTQYGGYGINEKPYVPGLNSMTGNALLRRYSAGTECSGFVHRSSAWSDAVGDNTFYHPYLEYADSVTQYYDDAEDISVQGVVSIMAPRWSWKVMDIGDDEKDLKYIFTKPLVPGDVLIMHDNTHNHIAIIQSIRYSSERGFKREEVIFIESAGGLTILKRKLVVMNWQTLNDYFNSDYTKNWLYSWHRLCVYGNNY